MVVVRSSLHDGYRRRVLVPLVQRSALPKGANLVGTRTNAVSKVKGQSQVLHPLEMVSVASEQLGPRVGSLSEHGQAIAGALDEFLMTRSWA